MRLILEAEAPHDYVLSTGISHRLSFFVEKAFTAAGVGDWRTSCYVERHHQVSDTNKMVGDSRAAYLSLGGATPSTTQSRPRWWTFDLTRLGDEQALWSIPSP